MPKEEIVMFFILTFCLAKSLEYIDYIFLDCANIFCAALEVCLKKYGQVSHALLSVLFEKF